LDAFYKEAMSFIDDRRHYGYNSNRLSRKGNNSGISRKEEVQIETQYIAGIRSKGYKTPQGGIARAGKFRISHGRR